MKSMTRFSKIKTIFLAIIFCGLFAVTKSSLAATYYVDGNLPSDCTSGNYSTANRACNGTSGNAYNMITDVNGILAAGDTVYIRAGTYAQAIDPTNSGTTENFITYSRYASETVTLTYTGAQADLNGKSYFVIDGLNFQNTNSYWIDMRSSHHITVQNCVFTNALAYQGIHMGGSNRNKILNSTFNSGESCPYDQGCPADFIWANTSYSLFEGNTFNKSGHTAIDVTNTSGTERNIIRNNTFDNPWHTAIAIYGTSTTSRNVVENNIIKNTGSDYLNNPILKERDSREAHHGVQIGSSGSLTIVRRNTFYNNGRAIVYSSYNPVLPCRFNKIYNNTLDNNYWGINSNMSNDTEISNSYFKNNSITNTQVIARQFMVSTTNTARDKNYYINNNIYGQTGFYKGATGNLAALDAAWDAEFAGNLDVAPEYTNAAARDFTLQATSNLINNGTWLTTITSANGSGSSFTVADAGYFMDGWGIVEGDTIQLESQAITAKIESINYSTNSITVDKNLNWTNDLGVALAYSGTKPDIGAYEYQDEGDVTAPQSPTSLQVR